MSIAKLHELAAALDQHNEKARSAGRVSPADFELLTKTVLQCTS
jgi:hypothetical protein